jgi:hypothetical protein
MPWCAPSEPQKESPDKPKYENTRKKRFKPLRKERRCEVNSFAGNNQKEGKNGEENLAPGILAHIIS